MLAVRQGAWVFACGMREERLTWRCNGRTIVEFYFADSNLPYDRYVSSFLLCLCYSAWLCGSGNGIHSDHHSLPPFLLRLLHSPLSSLPHSFMWTLHTKTPSHWIPLETVASFKRMREYTSALGLPALADLLRTRSEELEVDEEGKNVRRRKEVEEPKGQWERSVYAVSHSLLIFRCRRVFYFVCVCVCEDFAVRMLTGYGGIYRKDSRRNRKASNVGSKSSSSNGEKSTPSGCAGTIKRSSRCVRPSLLSLLPPSLPPFLSSPFLLLPLTFPLLCTKRRCGVLTRRRTSYTQGSVFVEFADYTSVTSFLSTSPPPTFPSTSSSPLIYHLLLLNRTHSLRTRPAPPHHVQRILRHPKNGRKRHPGKTPRYERRARERRPRRRGTQIQRVQARGSG